MADVWTKNKRSEVMSLVRSRGNKDTEMVLVRLLRKHKITGWPRHVSLLGKPDFTFREHRVTVFVDGCFWHCCPKHGRRPKSNRRFWRHKFSMNKKRDKYVNQTLRRHGWRVLRIWEHALNRRRRLGTVRRIQKALSARHTRSIGPASFKPSMDKN
jgi:DNA mismatch endonuclease (patch repair protein)